MKKQIPNDVWIAHYSKIVAKNIEKLNYPLSRIERATIERKICAISKMIEERIKLNYHL